MLDAVRDGRIHLDGPVAAVGGEPMTLPLAHLGHWYVTGLYVAPLLVVVVALKVRDYREAHPKGEQPEGGTGTGTGKGAGKGAGKGGRKRADAGSTGGPPLSRDPLSRATRAARATSRRTLKRTRAFIQTSADRVEETVDRVPVVRRFRQFPWHPMRRAAWFERQVEPHDIWHGMWAGSLPALSRVRRRHGGRTVYDARDVFLRARLRAGMPGWERRILTWFERRWSHAADAVIQVSEPYAAMMQRDLGLPDMPVVRNCPDRWDPPQPRPDRFRELLGLAPETAIVLYQGLLMRDRGIETTMDAILQVPDAVLVLMGFGDQSGRGSSRDDFALMAGRPPYLGKVHMVDPVAPAELLTWSASSDIMVMAYPDNSENHQYTTPQKLWEAMAAGVPVVASDLPGMAPIVTGTGCGVLCDASSADAIAAAIRQLLDEGPAGLRARGDRGLAAAHETYNWEAQFEVLDGLYARLLGRP
jgi:glycosyltransferase involved in cell wall biosynthesis